jgi:hypothetical protein
MSWRLSSIWTEIQRRKRCFSSITKELRSVVTILTNWRRKRLPTSSRSLVGINIHSNAPSKKLFGYPRRSSILTNVRFGSKADICGATSHVRFTPDSDRERGFSANGPLWAYSGHWVAYSITSLACASSDGGTVRPSPLAVFRLITISNLVAACTGRSAGFSPLRMRST